MVKFLWNICGRCMLLLKTCSHLVRIVQQCWTWVYALVHLSISNISQHLTTGCPNACNLFAPNSVAICCVQMLWLFGHSLKVLDQQFCNGSVEMLRSFGMGFIPKGILHFIAIFFESSYPSPSNLFSYMFMLFVSWTWSITCTFLQHIL